MLCAFVENVYVKREADMRSEEGCVPAFLLTLSEQTEGHSQTSECRS